ncbi:hypothetical protein H8E77_18580 [bacterium]|nr:hypothetical protein [bacterium]
MNIVPKSMDKYSYDMELTEGNRFNLLQQMDRSLHLRILFQSVKPTTARNNRRLALRWAYGRFAGLTVAL